MNLITYNKWANGRHSYFFEPPQKYKKIDDVYLWFLDQTIKSGFLIDSAVLLETLEDDIKITYFYNAFDNEEGNIKGILPDVLSKKPVRISVQGTFDKDKDYVVELSLTAIFEEEPEAATIMIKTLDPYFKEEDVMNFAKLFVSLTCYKKYVIIIHTMTK